MPKYFYRCTNCKHELEIYHSMQDCLQNCEECELEESLIRVPSLIYYKTAKHSQKTKKIVGSVVSEFIENTKQELEVEKEEMKKELSD